MLFFCKEYTHASISFPDTTFKQQHPILCQMLLKSYFPISKKCMDKTFDSIYSYQGVNFLKICEGLASLNFHEFCQRVNVFSSNLNCVASKYNFCNNEMFSFPSNDQIMNIFLDAINEDKELYEENPYLLKVFHVTTHLK